MLFFSPTQIARARQRFAISGWPDFDPGFLFQPSPAMLKPYRVLRFDGQRFTSASTTDAKFASWIITENSVASQLASEPQRAMHLDAAIRWVTAAFDTPIWSPQFVGNTDLYHGNLLYALSMFVDLCADSIDSALKQRVIEMLLVRGRVAHAWFAGKAPADQRYTQNHFYIPLTGVLCAALVLRDRGSADQASEAKAWIETVRPYPPLVFDALGADGWFFEGTDYFHYAFIWMIRLAELAERHLDQRVARKPCFTELKHVLKWAYFPAGPCMFNVGDASAKQWNFSRWSERETGQKLVPDNWLQNFSHVLYWRGDAESRALADSIRARGTYHWYEGFWCLLWNEPSNDHARPRKPLASTHHHFADFGVWCADRAVCDSRMLRILTKAGAPAGRSIWNPSSQRPIYAYDAGHVHPDAGAIYAALDDVPIILGPGYLGRKSGTAQNTISFDGRGQGDDRIYHALDPGAIDYARWMNVTSVPDPDSAGVTMDFAAAYDESLGVDRAVRRVRLGNGDRDDGADDDGRTLFTIHDELATRDPRRPEARFRITDPIVERGDRFVRWRVSGGANDSQNVFELRIIESSAPIELFVQIGEVITMNDDGTRGGGFEAGNTNQRGYQIIIRPIDRTREMRWTIEFCLR